MTVAPLASSDTDEAFPPLKKTAKRGGSLTCCASDDATESVPPTDALVDMITDVCPVAKVSSIVTSFATVASISTHREPVADTATLNEVPEPTMPTHVLSSPNASVPLSVPEVRSDARKTGKSAVPMVKP